MSAVPIPGERRLPAAYDHPHASDRARAVAEAGLILRVQVGSGLHGTAVRGQDDRDEMGVCLEPAAYVTGLARVPAGSGPQRRAVPFEQYERHTAWDRPGGTATRSGAGDLDVVVYSARKWARLALSGNPTVSLVLFVPDHEVVFRDQVGCELVDHADRFVSALAGERFLGYLRAQRRAMDREAGSRAARPELVAAHGYDTKFAMHALRLGHQGVELLTTGRITLPVPEPTLTRLRAVRRGEVSRSEVLTALEEVEADLVAACASRSVPAEPDRAWVDGWLHRSHVAYWNRGGQVLPE